MSQEKKIPSKAYPSLLSAASPHTSGGGAMEYNYTGTSAIVLNCTALAGMHVEVYSEVTSDGTDGSVYRYLWHTSATPPTLQAADLATASSNPTNKLYRRFSGATPASEVVDVDRPYLICVPGASIGTAENIIVAVTQPDVTS